MVRAGDMMMSRFGTDVRIDKKGAIDLVTEVDLAIEREFREMIAERFPDHAVLGEEMGGSATAPTGRAGSSIRSTAPPTSRTACRSSARRWRSKSTGVAQIAAIYDPTRKELFTAERGVGAFLNGSPMRVSSQATLIDALLVTGFPYDVHARVDEIVGLFGEFVGRARAVRRLGSAAIDLCYVAAGRLDGFWERDLKPWDIAGGRAARLRSRRHREQLPRRALRVAWADVVASNGRIHAAMLDVIAGHARSTGH